MKAYHKCVIEGREDVAHAEHRLALAALGSQSGDSLLSLLDLSLGRLPKIETLTNSEIQ